MPNQEELRKQVAREMAEMDQRIRKLQERGDTVTDRQAAQDDLTSLG